MPSLLLRKYAALTATLSIPIPSSSKSVCNTLLTIINDPHLTSYPPSHAYQTRFFKRLVDELEARADYPIDEEIYEAFMDAMAGSSSEGCSNHSTSSPGLQVTPPSPSYRTHYYPLRLSSRGQENGHRSPPGCLCAREQADEEGWGRLTVFESPSLVEAGTTGLRTWRAALWMGEWLLAHSEVVKGKKVLELGSGTGFLGILVAQLQLLAGEGNGVGEVWMTDCSDAVLHRCANNVHLPCNNLEAHPGLHTTSLDWTSSLPEVEAQMQQMKPDVVIACDVVFDTSIVPDLVKALRLTLGTAGACWVAGAIRNEETTNAFIREAENQGLRVRDTDWAFGDDERVFLGGSEGGEGMGEVRLMCLTKGVKEQ
ncbi:hypothetical protein DACRYDRAFT_114049 [Dacryopinax primogenitus]|uniref:Uncharacterized protein n=1 Tax=Dacryopinax primogenitus (strain DJM 731) TaxID=1858805 RepID=M5G945_DACPD|nr:uncharacterized protein DACRYDRAFT_114049 [Dacryopinax primogenitus]EJU04695.1 hypothetical protein DACRYDRAFT_114049 [Dacryopinax primogenitus]